MNTFGKILVVCNLLAALGAFALLWAVGPRRENWRVNSEGYKDQLLVAKKNSEAKDGDITTLNQENKRTENDKRTLDKEMMKQAEKFKSQLEDERAKATAFELSAKEADLNVKREQAEKERLKLEIDSLAKSLQRSEQDKLALQETANRYRKEAADYKNEREATQARNVNLVELLRQKEKAIQELTKSVSAGGGSGSGTLIVKNPNDANPPPVKVRGEIMQVSRDQQDGAGLLVKLSVGIDHGVGKNHTLDVYRTFPTPEYLGRVRIIDVTERDSVGRLVGRGATTTATLRVGDLVVDTIASLGRQ